MCRGRFAAHAVLDDLGDELADGRAVPEAERVRLAERLPDGSILFGGTSIGPDEDLLEKLEVVQFIDAEERVDVERARNIREGQGRQIVFDKWDVGRKPRDAFIDIIEGLQIGQLHHDEEGLFKWIFDGAGFSQHFVEVLVDELGPRERMKDRALYANIDAPNPPRGARIGEEVLCEDGMQVEDRMAVEARFLRFVDEEFDGVLVVPDHLRVVGVAALGLLAELDQTLRIKERISVALKAARIP